MEQTFFDTVVLSFVNRVKFYIHAPYCFPFENALLEATWECSGALTSNEFDAATCLARKMFDPQYA
jgi:hypothetical protein